METILLCAQKCKGSEDYPSLATRVVGGYLASHLKDGFRRVKVWDIPTDWTPAQIAMYICRTDATIVGFSCYAWNIHTHLKVVDLLSEMERKPKIIMGGPHMWLDQEDIDRLINRHPGIDLIVQGQGEIACLNYMLSPEAYPKSLVIKGEMLSDINLFPISVYEMFPPECTSPIICLETIRGCINRCAHCGWALSTKGILFKKGSIIRKEIEWAVSQGVIIVEHADSAINIDSDHLEETVDAILMGDPDGVLQHFIHINIHKLDEHQIRKLAKLYGIAAIGLETTNTATNRLLKRTFDEKKIRHAINLLLDNGIVPQLNTILGLPGDTFDDFMHTLEFVFSFDVPVYISVFHVLPGTEYYYRRHELGLVYDEEQGNILVSSPWMSSDDMERAREFAQIYAREAYEKHRRRYNVRLSDPLKWLLPWDDWALSKPPPLKTDRQYHNESIYNTLRDCVKTFFSRFIGLKLMQSTVQFFHGVPVLVCTVMLRTGDSFQLAFAKPDAPLEYLAKTPDYLVIYVPSLKDEPPVVRQAVRWLEKKIKEGL